MPTSPPEEHPPAAVEEHTAAYLDARERAAEAARCGADGLDVCATLSQATDAWVAALWRAAAPAPLADAALLWALGGYGRCELSFGSDLDVLVEIHEPALLEDPNTHLAVERWMRWCRRARITLSHVVRTPSQGRDELERDWRTPVALLDERLITEERAHLPDSVGREAALEVLRDADQGRGLVAELIERHQRRRARHGQTVYLLEPDVKSGAGGLRELHTLHWAGLVRFGASPLHSPLPEQGWSARQRDALVEANRWLHRLRHALHLRHGRKHDRLLFPDQEELAAELFPEHPHPAEQLMRQHYQMTRRTRRLSERALRRWSAPTPEQAPAPLGPGLVRIGGELDAQGPRQLEPSQIMEALELADRHELLLAASLEQRMAEAVQGWGATEREDAGLQARLLEMLTSPEVDARTGVRLLELGVLEALMPEFGPLVCHVQHDIYHVYTTDVHTLRCLERARALAYGGADEVCDRWPMFRQIAARIERPRQLLLAALTHDIGKNRGGDHSRRGAAMIPEIGRRFGLPGEAIDELTLLVREHLVLSNTARRRDTSDPRVLRELCARLRTVEALDLLGALTFCDMSTVSPEAMNDWRAMLLFQLHERVRARLAGGLERSWRDQGHLLEARRDELLEELTASAQAADPGALRGQLDEFLRDLPAEHLAQAPTRALARQFLAYHQSVGAQASTLRAEPLPELGLTEVIVTSRDVPGALAKIAGVFSAFGVNILSAELLTTASGRVLDIFRVLPGPRDGGGALPARKLERLERHLLEVLDEGADVEQLLRQRLEQVRLAPRPAPTVEVEVRELEQASDTFTVLELRGPDRLGLLYEIAATLHRHGVDTHSSKLDHLGNKVVDTFYVEDVSGGRLTGERLQEVLEALGEAIMHSPILENPRAPGPPRDHDDARRDEPRDQRRDERGDAG